MITNDLISVVVPTYNRSKILPRAIDSVTSQTYENWELLIIDDGSTDNTEQMIQERYGQNSRIKYIKRPDGRPKGANACRNIGAEKGKGEYLAFLDSDDEWLPNHLEVKLDKISKVNSEFIFGAFLVKKDDNNLIKECYVEENKKNIETYLLSNKADIRTSTFLLDRESFLKVKFDEKLKKHQDWDFALRFCKNRDFEVNHKPTVNLHIDHDRMSNTLNHEATSYFLQQHKKDLKPQTYKIFLIRIGLSTFLLEGNNEAFQKYSNELRRLKSLKSIKYHLVAYIFILPGVNTLAKYFIKMYRKASLDWLKHRINP